MTSARPLDHPSLAEIADAARLNCSARLDAERRVEMGQFFTPSIVGRFMAAMFTPRRRVRLLDPGAGVGSLTAAFVETAMTWSERPVEIEVAAFEADDQLLSPLRSTLAACRRACRDNGVRFSARVIADDFIHAAVASLDEGVLLESAIPPFDAVIMNPPYRKIRSSSRERTTLRRIGVETCNLYSAFLALAGRLLGSGGEMVAITPRSFCNGPYFRPFRESFFAEMTLHRAHVFERRDKAFRDDDVLQENIVFHAVRERSEPQTVVVSTSACPSSESVTIQRLRAAEVLDRRDPELIVRLPTGRSHRRVAAAVRGLPCDLGDLGLTVSTGRVVDFRAREFLRPKPTNGTAPLVYPETLAGGRVAWPKDPSRKAQAIARCDETEKLLVDAGHYVLVKRFSAKEERRRIVAAVYDPGVAPGERVGFENHLNYYHRKGNGLDAVIATGLAAFLNSTVVDTYFRQESGHTQVNASDLRRLRYPAMAQLRELADAIDGEMPDQGILDRLVARVVGA